MNHAERKTRRQRKFLGEAAGDNSEYDRLYEEAELAHDLAQLGGSNADPRNFVTMHQYANTPVMRAVEGQVRRAVERGGQTVRYRVPPQFTPCLLQSVL
ncbi:DNA/RNA non-specific endonuclease [Streptomyces sp. NPDC050121]|uniref:DNA/RNA non-specific endonuclease n=1 Tax=Streptomyces sp. NPDC050121 TaxID=3365601 RepID=UPI0037A32C85